eukprot:Selendium_serpulae@DN9258_c0_g1_i1.p1
MQRRTRGVVGTPGSTGEPTGDSGGTEPTGRRSRRGSADEGNTASAASGGSAARRSHDKPPINNTRKMMWSEAEGRRASMSGMGFSPYHQTKHTRASNPQMSNPNIIIIVLVCLTWIAVGNSLRKWTRKWKPKYEAANMPPPVPRAAEPLAAVGGAPAFAARHPANENGDIDARLRAIEDDISQSRLSAQTAAELTAGSVMELRRTVEE